MSSSTPVRCGCRKHAITGLRCSRCDAPICPDCSKAAPIGFFCRACASSRKSPLYQVSASSFAVGLAVGLAVASFGGWLLAEVYLGGFFGLVAGFFFGTAVGEAVLRVTQRKRGTTMEILAGSSVAGGLILGRVIFMLTHSVPLLLLPHYLFNPMALVMLGVCAFGAVNRVRFI